MLILLPPIIPLKGDKEIISFIHFIVLYFDHLAGAQQGVATYKLSFAFFEMIVHAIQISRQPLQVLQMHL